MVKRTTARKIARLKSTDTLTKALDALQAAEAPFHEGMQLLKKAKKQCGELLANANRHAHAMRALGVIAAAGCQFKKSAHTTCAQRDAENRSTWCHPCYAKHTLDGGTP